MMIWQPYINWKGDYIYNEQHDNFACAIFTNSVLDVVGQVQKEEKVRVEVHYFKILKIHWIWDLNKQEITFID